MKREDNHMVLSTEEARQAQPVRGMTTVLVIGTVGALIAMAFIAVLVGS